MRSARGCLRWMFARCTLCELEASNATRMHKNGRTALREQRLDANGKLSGWESLAQIYAFTRKRLGKTRVALLKRALADCYMLPLPFADQNNVVFFGHHAAAAIILQICPLWDQ